MQTDALPLGFLAGGRNVGVKNSKPDCGVLLSEGDAVMAAVVSTNRCRGPNLDRIERIRRGGRPVRAVLAVSGNANALIGKAGIEADAALANALADQLDIHPDEVLTAYTGVLGYRLPVERVEAGLSAILRELTPRPEAFAQAILTTDRVTKVETRELFISGTRVRIQAICKGSGMIAPSLATVLCFVATDAVIDRELLQAAVEAGVACTFNRLVVDGGMSPSDAVIAMANGRAKNEPIARQDDTYTLFADALRDIFERFAQAIADDGEGANRRLEVHVTGASSEPEAELLARSVTGSLLVKTAIFGADPNAAARIVATVGGVAAGGAVVFDPNRMKVTLQDFVCFEAGGAIRIPEPSQLRLRLQEPVVRVEIELAEGAGEARSWGCDLSYDYVRINADYAAITETLMDGRVLVNERLAELGPTIKRKLLVEALRYIERFKGIRAVIKLGGAAMIDPTLEEQFAEDVLLLRAVGLRPIVVHGGGPEISRTMKRLGQEAEFVDGLRVTDGASMQTVEMVLTGSVNQRLVAALNRHGSRAVGLSGKDGALIRARKMATERDLGQVGDVESIDPRLLDMLEKDGYVPVISPVGLGSDGVTYNINADVAAAELARATRADKLIFLSDVPGLLEGDRVVSELTGDDVRRRLDQGEITGGMRPKLESALRALRGGLSSVHLVDGRVRHNLIAELFTDRGVGTLIRRS